MLTLSQVLEIIVAEQKKVRAEKRRQRIEKFKQAAVTAAQVTKMIATVVAAVSGVHQASYHKFSS